MWQSLNSFTTPPPMMGLGTIPNSLGFVNKFHVPVINLQRFVIYI